MDGWIEYSPVRMAADDRPEVCSFDEAEFWIIGYARAGQFRWISDHQTSIDAEEFADRLGRVFGIDSRCKKLEPQSAANLNP